MDRLFKYPRAGATQGGAQMPVLASPTPRRSLRQSAFAAAVAGVTLVAASAVSAQTVAPALPVATAPASPELRPIPKFACNAFVDVVTDYLKERGKNVISPETRASLKA